MKTLKITLLLALFVAAFTSCTRQDLNEDNVLDGGDEEEETNLFIGGQGHD